MQIELVFAYWIIAAAYGFVCNCWRPNQAMTASEILAARFGVTKELVFQSFVIVAAVVWPICAPLDILYVLNNRKEI